MDQKKDEPALSVEVGAEHVSAQVSDRALSRFGQAAAWLFPKKDAKAKITAALAHRVSEKIKLGTPLDESELYFVGRMFDREARHLANTEQMAERTQLVLPEVQKRLKELPQDDDDSVANAGGFVSRAEAVAAEITEDDVRDLFARVLAGEISMPGSFSLRTLEVIRVLDPRLAQAFSQICNLVFDYSYIFDLKHVRPDRERLKIADEDVIELEEAGLLGEGGPIVVEPEQVMVFDYGKKAIRVTGPQKRRGIRIHDKWLGIIRLTRVGREIAAVLPFNEDADHFRSVVAGLAMEIGETGKVEFRDSDSTNWSTFVPPTPV